MVQRRDDVVVGWDSQTSYGGQVSSLAQPKAFVVGGIVVGLSGTTKAMDVVRYMEAPEYDGSEPYSWLTQKFVPVLEATVEGVPGLWNEEKDAVIFSMLAAVGGKAFLFDGLLSPSNFLDVNYAVGSGAKYALGALHMGASVMDALHTAAEYDVHTGGAMSVCNASSMIGAGA